MDRRCGAIPAVWNNNTQPVTNGYGYSDCHFYARSNSYCNGDSYSHTYPNTDTYSAANSDRLADANPNTHFDSAAYAHTKVHSTVAASAHSAASPVGASGEGAGWNALSLGTPQPRRRRLNALTKETQLWRLIFAPSATYLASSSEKPIHPRLSISVWRIDWCAAENSRKCFLLLSRTREKNYGSQA